MEHGSTANITLLATSLFVLTYFMSSMNGHVAASGGGYGYHLWLMYVNAHIGCMAVIYTSTKISKNRHILTIGEGSAVVLGLHTYLQAVLMRIVTIFTGVSAFSWWSASIMTILLLALHIPIIHFINKHCPYLIGKRK